MDFHQFLPPESSTTSTDHIRLSRGVRHWKPSNNGKRPNHPTSFQKNRNRKGFTSPISMIGYGYAVAMPAPCSHWYAEWISPQSSTYRRNEPSDHKGPPSGLSAPTVRCKAIEDSVSATEQERKVVLQLLSNLGFLKAENPCSAVL